MKMKKFKIPCIFVMALILILGAGSRLCCADSYQYTLEAGSYEIVTAEDGYQEIKMEGFGQLLTPGKPKLPSKIFSIAIPHGVQVDSVQATGMELTELDGIATYRADL